MFENFKEIFWFMAFVFVATAVVTLAVGTGIWLLSRFIFLGNI